MSNDDLGWDWFDSPLSQTGSPQASGGLGGLSEEEAAKAFARCFSGRNGDVALKYLRALTFERHLGPQATDAALRHVEGQRHLVAQISALIARGRGER